MQDFLHFYIYWYFTEVNYLNTLSTTGIHLANYTTEQGKCIWFKNIKMSSIQCVIFSFMIKQNNIITGALTELTLSFIVFYIYVLILNNLIYPYYLWCDVYAVPLLRLLQDLCGVFP